jgi:hypothetical protein
VAAWIAGGALPRGAAFFPAPPLGLALPAAALGLLATISVAASIAALRDLLASGRVTDGAAINLAIGVAALLLAIPASRGLLRARAARRATAEGRWRQGALLARDAILFLERSHRLDVPRAAVLERRERPGGAGTQLPHRDLIVRAEGGGSLAIPVTARALWEALPDWQRSGRVPPGVRPPA